MSNPSDTLKGLTGLAPQAMTLLEGAESLSLLPEEVAYTEEIAREFRKNNGPRFDLLDSYWNSKEIEDTVNQFMFNDLIRAMAFFPEDPRNLAAFKEYMLQDHWFLIELYKFKEKCLQSITKYDSASYANEMAGLARFKDEYIDGEFKLMLETLGVAHLRDHVEPHEVTKAYCDWMMKRAELDSFFELNLIQAPCTYGWSKLAQDIYHDKNFKREGLFFEIFIKPNVTDWLEFEKKERDSNGKIISNIVKEPQEGGWSSYAIDTAAFANTRMKPSHWTRELGIELIKQGLEHECALFKAAYQLADRNFAAQKLDGKNKA